MNSETKADRYRTELGEHVLPVRLEINLLSFDGFHEPSVAKWPEEDLHRRGLQLFDGKVWRRRSVPSAVSSGIR